MPSLKAVLWRSQLKQSRLLALQLSCQTSISRIWKLFTSILLKNRDRPISQCDRNMQGLPIVAYVRGRRSVDHSAYLALHYVGGAPLFVQLIFIAAAMQLAARDLISAGSLARSGTSVSNILYSPISVYLEYLELCVRSCPLGKSPRQLPH